MVLMQQLILRVNDSVASRIKAWIARHKLNTNETQLIAEVKPDTEAGQDDCFVFTFDGHDYPALLLNLPTIVETQKTFDRKIFFKSADIGQILMVFDSPTSRAHVKEKQTKLRNGETFYMNGLTPPTANIIKNRFELTQKSVETIDENSLRAIVDEISTPWLCDGKPIPPHLVASSNIAQEYTETITEEVVDFEEWMLGSELNNDIDSTGLVYKVDRSDWNNDVGAALEHPEVLEPPKPGSHYIIR